MLELGRFDLETIAAALQDQSQFEHRYLVDPVKGEIVFWSSDTGIDGHNRVDLDDLDPALIAIDPLPTWVWYQDMADFAELLSDDRAGERLARAIQGKGAFRRFRDELYRGDGDLLTAWHAFRQNRADRRAVEWLAQFSLVDEAAAQKWIVAHPDPQVP